MYFIFFVSAFFPELRYLFSKFEIRPFPSKAIDFFIDITKSAIDGRHKNKMSRTDFLQLMINHYKDNGNSSQPDYTQNKSYESYKERGITETEILANSLVFFLDGYDTTAIGLLFSVYRLIVHPEWQEKLIEEIDREIGSKSPEYETLMKLPTLDMYFSEVMRMYPPSTRTNRKAMREMTINGYKIPKGVEVTVPIYSMHYDPELWPNPEKFDPYRFLPENQKKRNPYSYMPFGHGPRSCIGMRLAQLETKMAIVRLLQTFRLCKASETKIEFDNTSGGILRPLRPLMVNVVPR